MSRIDSVKPNKNFHNTSARSSKRYSVPDPILRVIQGNEHAKCGPSTATSRKSNKFRSEKRNSSLQNKENKDPFEFFSLSHPPKTKDVSPHSTVKFNKSPKTEKQNKKRFTLEQNDLQPVSHNLQGITFQTDDISLKVGKIDESEEQHIVKKKGKISANIKLSDSNTNVVGITEKAVRSQNSQVENISKSEEGNQIVLLEDLDNKKYNDANKQCDTIISECKDTVVNNETITKSPERSSKNESEEKRENKESVSINQNILLTSHEDIKIKEDMIMGRPCKQKEFERGSVTDSDDEILALKTQVNLIKSNVLDKVSELKDAYLMLEKCQSKPESQPGLTEPLNEQKSEANQEIHSQSSEKTIILTSDANKFITENCEKKNFQDSDDLTMLTQVVKEKNIDSVTEEISKNKTSCEVSPKLTSEKLCNAQNTSAEFNNINSDTIKISDSPKSLKYKCQVSGENDVETIEGNCKSSESQKILSQVTKNINYEEYDRETSQTNGKSNLLDDQKEENKEDCDFSQLLFEETPPIESPECSLPEQVNKDSSVNIEKPLTYLREFDEDLGVSTSQLQQIENQCNPEVFGKYVHASTATNKGIAFKGSITLPQQLNSTFDWSEKAQQTRQKLQGIVQDISRLNAVLARARREIWHQTDNIVPKKKGRNEAH